MERVVVAKARYAAVLPALVVSLKSLVIMPSALGLRRQKWLIVNQNYASAPLRGLVRAGTSTVKTVAMRRSN